MKTSHLSLAVSALILAGCDLSGLSRIENDFQLKIGLEPINTVVAGQIINTATQQPLSGVRLTFSGPDAGSLVDVYSDPITEAEAPSGMVTFGLRNSLVPTESNPALITITASADGYYQSSTNSRLTAVGTVDFVLRLTPDDVTSAVPGTTGIADARTQAAPTGAVQQTVALQLPDRNGVQSISQATIEQGTIARAVNGKPLAGQIRTEIRVFDGEEGVASLPAGLTRSETGDYMPVVDATLIKMTDASGRVAANFEGGGFGKVQTSCGVRIEKIFVNKPILYRWAESKVFGSSSIPVVLYPVRDEWSSAMVGSAWTELGENYTVIATICIGGTSANVDLSKAAHLDLSGGFFLSLTLHGLNHSRMMSVLLDNSANAGTDAVISEMRIKSFGTNVPLAKTVRVAAGQNYSHSFPSTVGYGPAGVLLPAGIAGTIELVLSTGQTVTHPFSAPESGHFSPTVKIPSLSALSEYAVTSVLSCPAPKKFTVGFTPESLDGLTVFYRVPGQSIYSTLDKAKITEKSATNSKIEVKGRLSLLGNKSYEVLAVMGTSQSRIDVNTPVPGQPLLLQFEPAAYDIECK